MNLPAAESKERTSWPRLVSELLFRNWGLKAIAFVLAAFMFVFTRDEVTRGFTVPLRVVVDPDRVLLTELPESIQVQVRGPWTRINRLQDYDFGVATLELDNAKPGPLEIDRASIVMPSGVVLSNIVYDHVDLRFDPVIERDVAIDPQHQGEVAPDYELVRVEAEPPRWRVRGGESFVQRVQTLPTETLPLQGADHDVEAALALARPPEGVTFVEEREAKVLVRAVVRPKHEVRTVDVVVVVPRDLDPTGVVPRTFEVELSGPLPDFRVLEGLGVRIPVEAEAVLVEGEEPEQRLAEVRFSWSDAVPSDVRERLAFDRAPERIELPAPPSPPPTLDEPPAE